MSDPCSPPASKKRKVDRDVLSPISRVLTSPNVFETLELQPPELDLLNRPLWCVQNDAIKSHFKKISRLVHPDRNLNNPKAVDAFQSCVFVVCVCVRLYF